MQAKSFIKILFFYSLFVMSFASAYLGKWPVLLTDILNIFLLYFLINNKKNSARTLLVLGRPVYWLFMALIILGISSSIINFVSPFTSFWGIRTFYRYVIFFMSCISFLNVKDVIFFEKWLPRILIVNLFFSAIQFFFLNRPGDINSGTLDGNGGLYVLCYVSLTYFIVAFNFKRINLKQLSVYLLSVLLIAIFAELKLVFFLIPLSFILSVLFAKKSKQTFITIALTLVVTFVGLGIISFFLGNDYTDFLTNKDELVEYSQKEGGYNFQAGGLNRGIALARTDYIFYSDNPIQRYIGFGIGTGSASPFINSDFFIRYGLSLSYHFFLTSYILIEQGWIGFLLYLLLWVAIMLRIWQFKSKNTSMKFWRVFGVILVINVLISVWYNASLISDVIWFLFLYLSIPFIYYKRALSHVSKRKF